MKWYMLKAVLVVGLILVSNVYGETHSSGTGGTGVNRPVASPSTNARLFELVSACISGRATPALRSNIGLGTGVVDNSQNGLIVDDGVDVFGEDPGSDFTDAITPPGGALAKGGGAQANNNEDQDSVLNEGGNVASGRAIAQRKCTTCHEIKDSSRSIQVISGINTPKPMQKLVGSLSAKEKSDLAAFFKSES